MMEVEVDHTRTWECVCPYLEAKLGDESQYLGTEKCLQIRHSINRRAQENFKTTSEATRGKEN